ncbi:hypothetical protein CSOJ01_10681, partial [Colletotrichum sojae]
DTNTYVYGPPNPFHTATIVVVHTSDNNNNNNNPFSTGNNYTSTGNNPTNQLTLSVHQDGDLEMGNNNLVGDNAQTNNYEPEWMDTDSEMTDVDTVMTDANSIEKRRRRHRRYPNTGRL